MRKRSFEIIGALTVILGVFVLLQRAAVPVTGQTPTVTAKAAGLKTPWGDADLQMPWRSASPQGVLSPAAFAVTVGVWPVTGTAARCRSTNTPRITVSAPMISKDRFLISHSSY